MADGKAQDALPAVVSNIGGQPQMGQPSGNTDPSHLESLNQTYTQDQLDKLVSERHSKLDKTIAQITKERDSLKTSHETLSAQFTDLQRRIDEEDEAKLKGDPDELDIYQRRKKVREEQAALRTEKAALEREKASNAERLQKAVETEWEGTVAEIAATAKGDPARLKAKAAQYGIADAEKLRGLAADLWPVGVTPDSGQTAGGGMDLNKLSAREQIARGLNTKH